jgi:hypothetical protein
VQNREVVKSASIFNNDLLRRIYLNIFIAELSSDNSEIFGTFLFIILADFDHCQLE